MRHLLEFRIQFFTYQKRDVRQLYFELCSNLLESLLNDPAPVLLVSHLSAFVLHELLNLRQHGVARINAVAEPCEEYFLDLRFEGRKIREHCFRLSRDGILDSR